MKKIIPVIKRIENLEKIKLSEEDKILIKKLTDKIEKIEKFLEKNFKYWS